MMAILTYLIEVSLCLATLYMLYALAFRKSSHFNVNRFYLLGVLALSFTIPALSIEMSTTTVGADYRALLESVEVNKGSYQSLSAYSLNGLTLVKMIYLMGILVLGSHILLQIRSTFKAISKGGLRRVNGQYVIDAKGITKTGSFLNYIFWSEPENLSEDDKNSILNHELVHVQHLHSIDILLAEIASIILWFNPFIYLLKKAIRDNHEYIADREVSAGNTEQYISLMARQTLFQNGLTLSSTFNSPQIMQRINMLSKKSKSSTATRYLLVAPLLLALIAVFSCESGNVEIQEEESNELALESVKTVEGDIFSEVDQLPEPDGGLTSFYQYIASNLEYPEQAQKNGIEGKVFVEFVVTKAGEVRDVSIMKGIGSGCDEAALSVVENSENWKPGVHEGQNVNVKMVLPITFKLD